MNILETDKLIKRYGQVTAVDRVSLSVGEGESVALIGANGAGKTTLLKLSVGLATPDGGSSRIAGYNVQRMPVAAKTNLGFMSDDPTAYDYLSGREFLTFAGRLRGMDGNRLSERIAELTPLFPIEPILDSPMAGYSRGNKQKVVFLAILLAKPKLLVIDEPIVGLDHASIRVFGQTIRQYARDGNAVLFVTHILEFAERYATRAVVLQRGRITDDVSPKDMSGLSSLVDTP